MVFSVLFNHSANLSTQIFYFSLMGKRCVEKKTRKPKSLIFFFFIINMGSL